ncbi:MAG: peptidoglycan DD-metalloendopeptidase family protein [Chloroflexota bacterium]|nr:peptidoglycan DD-metalloendopeptidase family protein [Chloroflexota bacterium]
MPALRRTVPIAALLAVLVVSGGGRPVARADEPNVDQAVAQQQAMEAELAAQREQLADLRRAEAELTRAIDEVQRELDSVGAQVAVATRQLNEVTAELERERRSLAEIRDQIAHVDENLRAVARDITASERELAKREAFLEEHLRAAYEQSQVSLLEILVSVDTFGEATDQLGYMLALSDEDNELVAEIYDLRARLEVRRQTLEDGRVTFHELEAQAGEREARLAARQADADAARLQLEALQAELETYLADQQSALEDARRSARGEEVLIEQQRRELEGQAELIEELKDEARRLDVAYHGRFTWPEANFFVTQEFGPTAYNSFHEGIDLAYRTPKCGGPVYAAGDGVVLGDGRPNADEGDTAVGVVIGHSRALQTWYWHLASETVDVGDEVRTGDLIGYEGRTGFATGCHLHFQVMLNENAVNPRDYLP